MPITTPLYSRQTAVDKKACPGGLLSCRESCPSFSNLKGACVYPYSGSTIDANLSGDHEHFNFDGDER